MKIIQMILCSAAISLIAVLPVNGQSQKQEKNGTSTAAPPASAQPAAKQAPESEKVKSGTKNTYEKKTAASPAPKKEETIEEKEKKTADNIEEVLKYGLQKERMLAVTKVLSMKTEAIKKRLQTVLTGSLKDEKDSDVKQKMIMVLGELKSEEAVPAIIASLGDDSEDVRIAAAFALQNIKAVSAKIRLLEELDKQDLSVDSSYTETLIRALGSLKAAEIIPRAMKAIEDMKTTRNIREAYVLMLGEVERKDQGDFLLKLFRDEEESVTVRSYAVNSIAKLGIKEAGKDINAMIDDINSYSFKKKKQYYTLYIYSVAALAKLGDPQAVPHLENALRSDSTEVRVKAVELLKQLKDKRTIDILKYKMEYDPSYKVRKLSREALKEMGVEVKEEGKPGENEETEEE